MGQTLYRTMMIRGSNGESRCRGAGESCRGKGKVGRGVDESVDGEHEVEVERDGKEEGGEKRLVTTRYIDKRLVTTRYIVSAGAPT